MTSKWILKKWQYITDEDREDLRLHRQSPQETNPLHLLQIAIRNLDDHPELAKTQLERALRTIHVDDSLLLITKDDYDYFVKGEGKDHVN